MNGFKKTFFLTLSEAGCYSSLVDLEYFSNLLASNNYHQVDEASRADLILVSTCIAMQETEDASVHTIGTIVKVKKTDAQLIVCGCMAQTHKNKLSTLFPDQVAGFYGPRETDAFIERFNLKPISPGAVFFDQQIDVLNPRTRSRKIVFSATKKIKCLVSFFSKQAGSRIERVLKTTQIYAPHSYVIRVAKGCAGSCTYCIIKHARGAIVSRPVAEVVREVMQALQRGYTHFVLVADDFASYGVDIGTDYPTLLRHIFAVNRSLSVSLCHVNPSRFMAKLNDFLEMVQPGRIVNIEYTVQHGSNQILTRMKRNHTIEAYIESIRAIHAVDPDITIKSHLLVGFPGESTTEFQANMRLLDRIYFDKLGIFKYSDRPGTPASTFDNKVSYAVKVWRQVRLQVKHSMKQAWYLLIGIQSLKA